MQTPDFSRSRIDAMINLSDPRRYWQPRLPWAQIEPSVAAKFERQARAGQVLEGEGAICSAPPNSWWSAGRSIAGRPKLPIRLIASLLYLKYSFNLSDEK